MYAIIDLADERIGTESYATVGEALKAFDAYSVEMGEEAGAWEYRLQGTHIMAARSWDGLETADGDHVGYIVGETPEAPVTLPYTLWTVDGEHVENYASVEEAIDETLENYWEDVRAVGFMVREGEKGRVMAVLTTEEVFADMDGIVAVTRLDGETTLSRYAVSYTLDDDDGHYVGTNVRRLGA